MTEIRLMAAQDQEGEKTDSKGTQEFWHDYGGGYTGLSNLIKLYS